MQDSEEPDLPPQQERHPIEEPRSAPELPDEPDGTVVEDDEESASDVDEDDNEAETVETDTEASEETPPEDESEYATSSPPKKPDKVKRFFIGYWHQKKWTIPLTLLVILAVIFAVPKTRYPLLASEMQRSFTVTVIDSKTNAPVSGAIVMIAGTKATTNNNGVAAVRVKVGNCAVTVSKQYYKNFSERIFVGIETNHNAATVALSATGRQVPVGVINTLTGKPVADAEISVLNTEAKTNVAGEATIVLPTTTSTYAATVTASGYNNAKAQITVTSKVLSSNTFSITPTGKVYFLSNLSGTIDVDSANLDGTDRQAVLAGTGSEDAASTSLHPSTDWKYLALLSKRDGGNYSKLFLINTTNNQETLIDGTPETFQIIGWIGHDFIYETTSAVLQNWQPGQQTLKSYDAATGKTITLDQTTAVGNATSYAQQSFGYGATQIVDGVIVYAKVWTTSNDATYAGGSDQILSINPDGSDKAILKSFAFTPSSGRYISAVLYSPDVVYFSVENTAGTTYYVYENSNLTLSNTITNSSFYSQYPDYFMSPSGNNTFWSTMRDGQNALLVGDANGSNGNTIDSLTSYAAYGWYTDNYVLVSKGGNTLYIMPVGGGKTTKIADYLQ